MYPETKIESFFNSLSWGDTMKTITSVLYQMKDDNPLSFYWWSGKAMHPNPYKGDPGHGEVAFEKLLVQIVGDSGRTSALLTADIISDVMVGDTFCVTVPGAQIAPDGVFVNSTILDEIKGKKIPYCVDEGLQAHRKSKGATPQSGGTVAWPTYAVPADTGSCLQFEYSPEWLRVVSDYGPNLMDSTGGWWIKPGHEYIVFLNFSGVGADKTTGYFTTIPGPANPGGGSSGCMYPVVDGIVQDPNDDFGIGASAGLTVAVWKSRIRARINAIITP
jgi:hypothetical protein